MESLEVGRGAFSWSSTWSFTIGGMVFATENNEKGKGDTDRRQILFTVIQMSNALHYYVTTT